VAKLSGAGATLPIRLLATPSRWHKELLDIFCIAANRSRPHSREIVLQFVGSR